MNYEAELEEKWEKWHTDVVNFQRELLEKDFVARQEPHPKFLIVLGVILLLGASVWALCGFVGVEK